MKTTTYSKLFTSLTVILVFGLMFHPIFANDLLIDQVWDLSNNFTKNTFGQVDSSSTSNALNSSQFSMIDPAESNDPNANTGALDDTLWLNPSFTQATSTPAFDLPTKNDGTDTNVNEDGDSAFAQTNDVSVTNVSTDITSDDVTSGLTVGSFTPVEENSGKGSEGLNHPATPNQTLDELALVPASFATASGTIAFVAPIDETGSLIPGMNTVVVDINNDGAPDVLTDCNEIDCIAYVNDGGGTLTEDGVVSRSSGDPVDIKTVLVAEVADSDASGNADDRRIAFFLKLIHLVDMDGDGHRDAIDPTNNGFLARYALGNDTFTQGDKYPKEDPDEEDPEDEEDPCELGDGECIQ